MTNSLELALLGNPEVRLAGQPLARLRSVKAYALLYYLAVTRRAQPRTVLAGLFWGDVDEYYARRNLNRTLSDVNKAIGAHLTVERQSLALARQEPYWLDVEVLDNAVAIQPTRDNVPLLAAAANLYRGDFLAGFYVYDAPDFEQWVLGERTRLQSGILQLQHALADFYAVAGDLLQAMDYARRNLQLEPGREESHRQLMLFLAQSGQRSAALAQFELCCQALRSELAVEPDAETLELVARIRAGNVDKRIGGSDDKMTERGDSAVILSSGRQVIESSTPPVLEREPVGRDPRVVPHNLPAQRTPFIGRSAELTAITRLLLEEADCRLLTVVGSGGMGKTRLAIKAAEQIVADERLSAHFGDGLFFISLENVSDANGLAAAVIAAITAGSGLRLQRDGSLQAQLIHLLRNKSMLLVLDNFEHLVMHADLCSTLLLAAPRIKLLVTSREAIGLQEAWFYPLGGLAMADATPEARAPQEEYDAVRLFVQCARRTHPDFALAPARAAVLRICSLVEGMPLGIELAATWLKVLNCEQIAEEITHGIDFLTVRFQNIPARHRSMRAVMDYSWTLLAPDERGSIARLAIFRGKFRQEAATAITGASLFMLVTLVDKALLRFTADGYYQMHELTRQYAAEQLDASAELALRNAHAAYYADLLGRQRGQLFTAAYRQLWATVGGELDNIRYAWDWLIDSAHLPYATISVPRLLQQMTEIFAHYYLFGTLWVPGLALFDRARATLVSAGWDQPASDEPEQAIRYRALLSVQLSSGLFHFEMGHYRSALAVAEQALATRQMISGSAELLWALLLYGRTQLRRGAHRAAIAALQEACALSETLGTRHYCVEALINLGLVASAEGLYGDAQSYLRDALDRCHQIGYRPWLARILTNLGTTYSRQYDYPQAQPLYEQAVRIAEEEADQHLVMICTSNLGGVLRGFQRYEQSLARYQQSLLMARTIGEDRWVVANLNGLAITYLEMADLRAAEPLLREALLLAPQGDNLLDTLGAIALTGHLYARRGQFAAALKMLLFVEQHPATMARDHLYNQPLLEELRSELSPTIFVESAAWANGRTLDEVVAWVQQQ